MTRADFSSWKLTEQERRQGIVALGQMASSLFLGPFGPPAALGLEFLYNRRHLIFGQSGKPIRAYSSDGSALELSTLTNFAAPRQGTLSLNAVLAKSARDLGLRDGDPVGIIIILADRSVVQGRSGLVVPTRVGERVDVAIPQGNYSLAALGSRRESLFTTPDPYNVVNSSSSILLGGHQQLELSLTARALSRPSQRTAIRNNIGTTLPRVFTQAPLPPARTRWVCPKCGLSTSMSVGAHFLVCPGCPAAFYCGRCSSAFSNQAKLDEHEIRSHSKSCSYCGLTGFGLGWHAEDCPIGNVAATWDKFKQFINGP